MTTDKRSLIAEVVRRLEALTIQCAVCDDGECGAHVSKLGSILDPAYAPLLEALTEPHRFCDGKGRYREAGKMQTCLSCKGTGRRVRDVEALDGAALFDALPQAFGVNVHAKTFKSGGCTVFAEGLATVSAPTLKEAVLGLLVDERIWENAALPEVKADA